MQNAGDPQRVASEQSCNSMAYKFFLLPKIVKDGEDGFYQLNENISHKYTFCRNEVGNMAQLHGNS